MGKNDFHSHRITSICIQSHWYISIGKPYTPFSSIPLLFISWRLSILMATSLKTSQCMLSKFHFSKGAKSKSVTQLVIWWKLICMNAAFTRWSVHFPFSKHERAKNSDQHKSEYVNMAMISRHTWQCCSGLRSRIPSNWSQWPTSRIFIHFINTMSKVIINYSRFFMNGTLNSRF